MAHLAACDFTQLSGGEQQLMWLAQLSLQDAQVYLLDEPTQQLDVYYRRQIFGLVHDWATQQGKTVLCSTHPSTTYPPSLAACPIFRSRSRSCAPFPMLRCARCGRGWNRNPDDSTGVASGFYLPELPLCVSQLQSRVTE